MNYLTEAQLRKILATRMKGRTQAAIAAEAGVRPNVVSMMAHNSPVTGKLLAWLGYKRVTQRLYRRVR